MLEICLLGSARQGSAQLGSARLGSAGLGSVWITTFPVPAVTADVGIQLALSRSPVMAVY